MALLPPLGVLGMVRSRTWYWQFALTLEKGGVGLDELVRRDIADGDARHDGGVGVWRECRWVRMLRDALLVKLLGCTNVVCSRQS